MELISRILDGSIPYSLKGLPQGRSFFGGRVSQDDKIDRLEEVALLEACTRKQLRAVARIAEVVEVPTGTVLARSGTPGEEFFLILDGHARVEVSVRKRARLGPGDYFGEMSLLDGGPRSATVVAETPLRLLVISAETSRRSFAKPPSSRSRFSRPSRAASARPRRPSARTPSVAGAERSAPATARRRAAYRIRGDAEGAPGLIVTSSWTASPFRMPLVFALGIRISKLSLSVFTRISSRSTSVTRP